MKKLIVLILILLTTTLNAGNNPDWFHLEGVSNPDYKVYLDKNSMQYSPGVDIIATLKYEYINSEDIQSAIHKIKFYVSENAYDELSKVHFYKSDTSYISEVSNMRHLIPGSEMSIIYQYVYIQAVTQGPK